MQLIDVLAGAPPQATALIDPLGGRQWTFAELLDRGRRLADVTVTAASGGAPVAIVGPNDVAWIDAYYGVPTAGIAATFVNHRLSPAQIVEFLDRVEPGLILADDSIELGPRSAVRFGADYEDALAAATPLSPASAGPGIAWRIPTSGTTGRAKIVQLTHASILAAARTSLAVRPLLGDEVYLFPFPLCHVAGYNVVIYHLAGRPVVIVPRFEVATVLDAVDAHAVTHISLAPTMIVDLLDHLRSTGRPAPASLRCITYGSAAIDRALLKRAIDVLGCDFAQGYGMTELSGNAVFLSPEDHRRGLTDAPQLLAAAGKPGPGVRVRLVDEAGADLGCGPGEVAVSAAQVMAGYVDDPQANEDTFMVDDDGARWMRTGDIGRFDDDGYVYLIDRKKDIIISGGENISSREVEEAMRLHPAVADVAVIGLPDERWGEIVCAVVVRGGEVGAEQLLDFARVNIGGYKKPRRIHFVEALPRTASGKVVKAELRHALAASAEHF